MWGALGIILLACTTSRPGFPFTYYLRPAHGQIMFTTKDKKEGLSHREPKLRNNGAKAPGKEAMIIDELDQQILKSIRENEKPAKVIDIIRPFFGRRSQRALRERLNKLHHLGYIELRKQAYGVLVIRKPEANHSRGEPLYV